MKYTDFKRYKFSTVKKYIDIKIYNILNIYRLIYIYIKKLNYSKLYKYTEIRKLDFSRLSQKISLKSYKSLPLFLVFIGAIWAILFISIPLFYNYSQLEIENLVCKNKNVKCAIKGKYNYSLFPSPRISIKDLEIREVNGNKNNFITVSNASIILSLKNLLKKEKQTFNEIILSNFIVNFELNKINDYKKILSKEKNLLPIKWEKGKIIFSEKGNYVATIDNVNADFIVKNDYRNFDIKGNFLDNNIYFLVTQEFVEQKPLTKLIFKIPSLNLVTKIDANNFTDESEIKNGKFLFKKDKNNFSGIFNYKNKEISIVKSNLRNYFLDGKVNGKVVIKPYFNFDLNVDLNSLNFTKLHNYVLFLNEEQKKNLFKINNKINGILNVNSSKVYSKHNLVKSFESRLKINNSNILINQFLFNLGKFGAADILGSINNDKKFTNFKFESNIFVDNEKKFLSKFGVYNKKNTPSNYFISGNIDLINFKSSFYEISGDEKYAASDVDFIEEQFNDIMLLNDYQSLFNFQKFQEFVKIITSEEN